MNKATAAEYLYYDYLQTGVGDLLLVMGKEGLKYVGFTDRLNSPDSAGWIHDSARLEKAVTQVREYLNGERRSFDVALVPAGTEFQRRVWQALREIPYGCTITYGELAQRVGSPRACRAVGNANGCNPIVIIQPCHRVIGANRTLGGFSAGVHRKKYLLEKEGVPAF